LLVGGVPVEYLPADGSGDLRGDLVRLIDWATPANNAWLAVNQFSITGPRHTRRPDIVLFVNGLPLVIIELKNPADAGADVWKAFHQLQTYKAQIGDVFAYNELLVISDGSDALLGSLSADAERFMGWRTIDGVALDPLGPSHITASPRPPAKPPARQRIEAGLHQRQHSSGAMAMAGLTPCAGTAPGPR